MPARQKAAIWPLSLRGQKVVQSTALTITVTDNQVAPGGFPLPSLSPWYSDASHYQALTTGPVSVGVEVVAGTMRGAGGGGSVSMDLVVGFWVVGGIAACAVLFGFYRVVRKLWRWMFRRSRVPAPPVIVLV